MQVRPYGRGIQVSALGFEAMRLPEKADGTCDYFLSTWRGNSVLWDIFYCLFDPGSGSEESSILRGAADVKDKTGSLYRMWSMYPGVSDGGFIAGWRHGED